MAGQCQKYQICMQDKLHAGQYSLFPHETGLRTFELFKVVPLHLILVAWICVCIIIGSLEKVFYALRQVGQFHIKFKLFVDWLPFARFFFQSSKFCHLISVWQL